MLIAAGLDVKVVRMRLRHASATTTLRVYAHLWPDTDESARAAVSAILADRFATRADSVRASGSTAVWLPRVYGESRLDPEIQLEPVKSRSPHTSADGIAPLTTCNDTRRRPTTPKCVDLL